MTATLISGHSGSVLLSQRSMYTIIILVHPQAVDERHEAELQQKDTEIQQKNVRDVAVESSIDIIIIQLCAVQNY